MEKLEQVDMDCVCAIECEKFEVCVEEIETEPEKQIQINEYKRPAKFGLSKLFKKSMINTNYAKETIPIKSLKNRQNFRIYPIY